VPVSISSRSTVKVTCSCGARLRVDGPGRFKCPECRGKLTVQEKLSPRRMPLTQTGVIPWSALSPEVRQAFHHGRQQVVAGRGPGAAMRGVTKRMGIKPCRGCWRRAQALDQLGWQVVIGFTVVVVAVSVGLARWIF